MARSRVDALPAHPAVSAFRQAPRERAGIFTDFDGTLSEIVYDPHVAKPVRGAAAALRKLARSYRVVAVISGRPARDLSHRMRVPGVRLIGIHGLEEDRSGSVQVPPAAEHMRAAVQLAASAVEGAVQSLAGVVVERKGLSAAVHFRRAADPDAAQHVLSPVVRAAAAAEGLVVIEGRRVLEMRPPAGGNKGDALARLVHEHNLRAVLVAGDDAGDLALFAAAGMVPVVCRIGIASAEAPAGMAEATDVILSGPREFVALLRSLV